jgi:phosphate uptake regulator
MSVESRKVQEVTGGTYTVSLPEAWAEDVGVSAGSVLDLHAHENGTLVVRPRSETADAFDRVTVACPSDAPRRVERVLRSAYAAGADEVVLAAPSGFSATDRRALESTTRALTGLTVEGGDDGRVSVRAMIDAEQVSVRQSVRQLSFVALSSHRDATAALVDGTSVTDPAAAAERAERLFALVDRHFERALVRPEEAAALEVTRAELFSLRTTGRELECIAEEARRLAEVANASDDSTGVGPGDAVADLATTARGVVEDAVSFAVGDGDATAAWTAFDRTDRVTDDLEALERTLLADDDVDYRLTHVLRGLERTATHGRRIAERGLRQAVRDGALASEDVEVDANVDQGADA